MTKQKTVLVTGVAGQWGRRVAAELLATGRFRVLGIDVYTPDPLPAGLDFISADIRNPLLNELLELEAVDTVCHVQFQPTLHLSEAMFDANVMGTMRLFGACAQAGVKRIVFKSSSLVYGAQKSNAAFLTEDKARVIDKTIGVTRYLGEIEQFCDSFRTRHPNTELTVLRFPNIVGPTMRTLMTAYLRQRYAPTLLGFDPMMQVIHEADVVAALVHAVGSEATGTFNIAADSPMPLTKLLGLAKNRPVPILHWLAYWWGENATGRLHGLVGSAWDYLRYPWVTDTSRMYSELGFAPTHTADEAIAAWVSAHVRRPDPEDDLASTISARRAAADPETYLAVEEE